MTQSKMRLQGILLTKSPYFRDFFYFLFFEEKESFYTLLAYNCM